MVQQLVLQKHSRSFNIIPKEGKIVIGLNGLVAVLVSTQGKKICKSQIIFTVDSIFLNFQF